MQLNLFTSFHFEPSRKLGNELAKGRTFENERHRRFVILVAAARTVVAFRFFVINFFLVFAPFRGEVFF